MGFAKEAMMHQEERRASAVGGQVCDECLADDALRRYIQENATEKTCSFCERSAEEPIAADADSVVDMIMAGVQSEWVDPVEELAYETAEGGYQGQQIDFDEVLEAVGSPIAEWAFQEALTSATCDHTFVWCKRDYAAPHLDEAMALDWKKLVEQVKYESRFLFLLSEDEHPEPGQAPSALAILTEIAEFSDAAGLIRTIPAGTGFWRARAHAGKETHETAAALGTARPEDCLAPNRMSPAGIPAFYGAETIDTALAEVRGTGHDTRPAWSAGRFSNTEDFLVLDLAELPEPPTIFDEDNRHLRRPLIFLAEFAEQISRPLEDGDREHIDYVPTQVVAEFLRVAFQAESGPVTGIRYRSAQLKGGVCVVLFVDQSRCVDSAGGAGLELVLGEHEQGTF
jgi:hypothetical protein